MYRAAATMRRRLPKSRSRTFSRGGDGGIQRILVINLDRQDSRWRHVQSELARIRDRDGRPLTDITRRVSGVDGRYLVEPFPDDVESFYSLAEQLFVDPHPLPDDGRAAGANRIAISRQEVAVALSHIRVWQIVAASDQPYALVLEDDVLFRRGFSKTVDRAWTDLWRHATSVLDLLYVGYEEARAGAERAAVSDAVFRPIRGVWTLSAYVLSRRGAQRLLDRLPVRGPVDLWINHQFDTLDVLALQRSVVEQRRDFVSDNAYSVMPVLSKVGLVTREGTPTFERGPVLQPVVAFGAPGTRLSALATALSMLGYRCCSDVVTLPDSENEALFGSKHSRVFDAYVNVGSLQPEHLIHLAKIHRQLRVIVTTTERITTAEGLRPPVPGSSAAAGAIPTEAVAPPTEASQAIRTLLTDLSANSIQHLVLPADHDDKWRLLSEFLGCDYPSHTCPRRHDQEQRPLGEPHSNELAAASDAKRLKWDSLPWIVDVTGWRGIPLRVQNDELRTANGRRDRLVFGQVDDDRWVLRDDTFPSNLALFRPANFYSSAGGARFALCEERTQVRDFTSASLSSRSPFLYGRFSAEIRPASVPGLITGMFLHRNAPRQEIDIEFLGNDTTKLLVNVYFNPGTEGARLEYGDRGTPELIDLGFDAADSFHRYEIEWTPTAIRWWVDDRLVVERVHWAPTPIPHLPMQFHLNLWHTRSKALAGKLARERLPAYADLRSVEVVS